MDNGSLINKIKLIPKSTQAPALSGHIYIIEDTWRIYGIHAFLKAKTALIGDIELKVSYTKLAAKDKWVPFSENFYLHMLSSQTEVYRHTVNSDYKFDNLNKEDVPTALRFRIANAARSKNEDYWSETRPIPLTLEERQAYEKHAQSASDREHIDDNLTANDSLDGKKGSKKNLAIHNIYSKPKYDLGKKWYLQITPLLKMFSFNTVEGGVINSDFSFVNGKTKKLLIEPTFRYGFSSQRFYGSLRMEYDLNPKKLENISTRIGKNVDQISGFESISPLLNTSYSLIDGNNYLKLYEEAFVSFRYDRELINGLDLDIGTEYSKRTPLSNTTGYSFVKREEKNYTPNVAIVNSTLIDFEENHILKYSASLTLNFKRPYNELPTRKEVLTSKYPVITIAYQGGIGDGDYKRIWGNVSDDWNFNILGISSISLSYGHFLTGSNPYIIDNFHFAGNRTFNTQRAGLYNLNYQKLDYYQFSSSEVFYGGNYKHAFKGNLLGKIPWLKKLALQSTLSANYLYTPDAGSYIEFGGGLENILGFLSVSFFQGFVEGEKSNSGIVISTPFR
jgi:hypothetical protein